MAGSPDEKGVIHVERLEQKRPERGNDDKRQRPIGVERQPSKDFFHQSIAGVQSGNSHSRLSENSNHQGKKSRRRNASGRESGFRDLATAVTPAQ
jgi:hypothetical protein